MLCINAYTQEHIDACRSRVISQLSAYDNLITAANNAVGTDETPLNSAITSFEPVSFNNMVLVIDSYFFHRSRTIEQKNGNPLNVLADKTIKMNPAKSVLKYQVGDEIGLNESDFLLISEAFFAEIASKYL